MIVGCSVRMLKWAVLILFLLLAPKVVRKARRSGKRAADRTLIKAPKQVKKIRRAARKAMGRVTG